MNLEEAYRILGLSLNSSKEEAKKKYHILAKELHPDINKDAGAEDKFKKINEAYSCVQSGKGTDREEQTFTRNPFSGFGFHPFRQRQRNYQPRNVQVDTTISFKESVFGCKKDISFNHKIKCSECNGEGEQQINNGCSKCHGMGTVTQQRGNMIFTQTCDKCGGVIQTKPCDKCKSSGAKDAQASVQVNIPGGIRDGNILRLSNMGDFVGNFMNTEQRTDVHLTVTVIPHPKLKLIENDVVLLLPISLLEALSGCTKTVETINGFTDVEIKPKSRNNEQIIIPNLGVNKQGSQRVILDVKYPDNIDGLIEHLSKINLVA